MITPLTITSLNQGTLKSPPTEEEYWAKHLAEAQTELPPFWNVLKFEWPRWSLRRRADQE